MNHTDSEPRLVRRGDTVYEQKTSNIGRAPEPLNDSEWSRWSNNEIAKQCGVSHTFVNSLRGSLETDSSDEPRTYTTRHDSKTALQNFAEVKGNSRDIAAEAEELLASIADCSTH